MRRVTEILPIVLHPSCAQLASCAVIYNLKLETVSCLSLRIKVQGKNIQKLFKNRIMCKVYENAPVS